jgi:hypothetical protein
MTRNCHSAKIDGPTGFTCPHIERSALMQRGSLVVSTNIENPASSIIFFSEQRK